jgi:hypothetical protein
MAETRLNREYALRLLGVGALMLGMCVWSLYDGNVGWPRHNRNLERVRPALLATNLTAEAWVEQDEAGVAPIDEVFRSAGLKAPPKLIKKIGELKIPAKVVDRVPLYEAQAKHLRSLLEKPVYGEHDLQTQTVQAVITLLFGGLAFLSVALKARRSYVADEGGLHGSGFGGKTVAFSDIARIDWSKWDEKGIVRLTVKSGQTYTLDGWHFSGMPGIVEEIRRRRPDLDEGAPRD